MSLSDPVHYASIPFQPLCGADVPGQSTTQIPEQMTCPDCYEVAKSTLDEMAHTFNEIGRLYVEAISLAVMQATEVMRVLAEQFAVDWSWWWNGLPPELTTYFLVRPPIEAEDMEAAFRAYAQGYNWYHPCKKISWRRLSRPQRLDAIERWHNQMSYFIPGSQIATRI